MSVCSDGDLTVVLGETLSQVPPLPSTTVATGLSPADMSASAVALDPAAGSSFSLKGLLAGTLTAGASWSGTTSASAAAPAAGAIDGLGRGGGLGARRRVSSSRATAPPPLGRKVAPQRCSFIMSSECSGLPPTCPAGRPQAGTRYGRRPPCPKPPWRRRRASRRRSSAITAESVAPGDEASEGDEVSMPVVIWSGGQSGKWTRRCVSVCGHWHRRGVAWRGANKR